MRCLLESSDLTAPSSSNDSRRIQTKFQKPESHKWISKFHERIHRHFLRLHQRFAGNADGMLQLLAPSLPPYLLATSHQTVILWVFDIEKKNPH